MLQQKVYELFDSEINNWSLAKEKYYELSRSLSKRYNFAGYSVEVVCNSARLRSTLSDVKERLEKMRTSNDQEAVKTSFMPVNDENRCFLCNEVRPQEQQSIDINGFKILVNPYPIFPKHFTIAHDSHIPQIITPHFRDMLLFAKDLPDFAVFYNGANCGASAPHHAHFQAGEKQYFNVIKDYDNLKDTNISTVESGEDYRIEKFDQYLRKAFCISTECQDTAQKVFVDFFAKEIADNMLNVICCYYQPEYRIFVFPRKNFRPTQFFEEDENKRLAISPASVEMSGRFVTIFQEHFDRITEADIIDIYQQIS